MLLSDTMEVAELSRLACLPIRRLRKATVNVWIERTKFRCQHCGSEEVSIYFERHRMVRGVANANIPVVIRFSAHRIYCRDCGERSYEEFKFLPGSKSHITGQLARTLVALRSEMSIKAISDYFDIPWDVVKNVEKAQLAKDCAKIPLNKVTALGIDETCAFRHAKSDGKYVTVVRDLETGEVPYVGDGKGVKALEGFIERIRRWRRRIRYVCMDMSNAYAKWGLENLPDAGIVFDHFHVVKAMNDRLDKIRRRTMAKADEELKKVVKGNRYLLSDGERRRPDAQRTRTARRDAQNLLGAVRRARPEGAASRHLRGGAVRVRGKDPP